MLVFRYERRPYVQKSLKNFLAFRATVENIVWVDVVVTKSWNYWYGLFGGRSPSNIVVRIMPTKFVSGNHVVKWIGIGGQHTLHYHRSKQQNQYHPHDGF